MYKDYKNKFSSILWSSQELAQSKGFDKNLVQ